MSLLFSKLFYVVTGLSAFAADLLPAKLHYSTNLRQLKCALVLSQNASARQLGHLRELSQKNELQHDQIKLGYSKIAKMERDAQGYKATARQMESDLQRMLRHNSFLEGQRRTVQE